MSMLLQASKEAGVAKKRVERELLTLERRAWHDQAAGVALQELRDIYAQISRDHHEKEGQYTNYLREVREHRLKYQTLQHKISKVRSTAAGSHAALFQGRPQTPSRGRRDEGWNEGMGRSGGLTLETRRSPSPAILRAGSGVPSPTSPSAKGSTQGLRNGSFTRSQSRGRRISDRASPPPARTTASHEKGGDDALSSKQPTARANGSARSISPAVGSRANTEKRAKNTEKRAKSRSRGVSREPANRKLVPAPRMEGFASRPVDEVLRRRLPMLD